MTKPKVQIVINVFFCYCFEHISKTAEHFLKELDPMLRTLFALLLLIAAAGCSHRVVQHVPYHHDGTPKAALALIPIVDSSDCTLPWYVGCELTNALRYQLMSDGKFFLPSEADVDAQVQSGQARDFFSRDLGFTRSFCNADYVVALELIEHAILPYEREKVSACFPAQAHRCNSMLQMKMRVRVIDVRCQCPRVILQEVFTSNAMIPKDCECLDYQRLCWGTQAFLSTPVGLAHKRLVRDLACRIQTVIEGF